MLSLFPFVPTHLLRRFSAVTVGTPYHATTDFLLNITQTSVRPNQKGNSTAFLANVVKVQDERICLGTINAWVDKQVVPDKLPFHVSTSLQVLVSRQWVLTVGLLISFALTRLTKTLKTVWLASVLIKLSLLLLNFTVRTNLQVRYI